MRLRPLILSLTALSLCVFAQDAGANAHKVKHDYQVCTLCLFCISESLTWTPNGTRILSGDSTPSSAIREWDSLTWHQVGHP
jgi:hypothetical protein